MTNKRRLRAVLGVVFAVLVVASSAQPAAAFVDSSKPTVGWRPSGGIAYSLLRTGNMVIIGGTFTGMVSASGATASRSRLAAIDATTGELLPWAPNPNGDVRALAVSPDGGTLYVGGRFTTIGGTSRANLAAVSTSTGLAATNFSADTNGMVMSLSLHQGGLLVGGEFGRIRGVGRGNGAEVDPLTGAVRSWNPNTNWGIFVVAPSQDGASVYIGGAFIRANGDVSRDRLAKVARTDGGLLPWTSGSTCQDDTNPCYVFDIEEVGSRVLIAQGGPGGRIASLDAATGVQQWWAGGDGDVQTIAVEGKKVYGGGHWEAAFNGVQRAGTVALDISTGAVLPELTAPVLGQSGVWQMLRDGDLMRLSGQFDTIGGAQIGKYSTFPVTPDPADTAAPAVPTTLRAGALLPDMLSLTWAAAADNVATTAYKVYRDGQLVGQVGTPFFRDTTVQPSTPYVYEVTALDAAGNESARSARLTMTAGPPEARLLPRGATWSVLSMGIAPASGWTGKGFDATTWATGSGEFGFGEGDETTYIPPRGVAHYFRTTFDVARASRIQSARLRLLLDDGAVIYLNGQEVARVNMPTGPVTNTTTAASSVGGTGETRYQDVVLPAGAFVNGSNVLAISVHNVNAGSSDVSMDAFISYQSTAPKPPTQVTGLAGVVTATGADLAWNPVPDTDTYTVRRDGSPVATVSGPSFSDSGLTPDTSYRYTVTATNPDGDGPASGPLDLLTDAVLPAQVVGLEATDVGPTQVELQWQQVPGADSYTIMRDGQQVASVTDATFKDVGLTPSTMYGYAVAASNRAGVGPTSAPIPVTTDSSVPPKVVGVAVEPATQSVEISWPATERTDLYVVRRDGEKVGETSATTWTDPQLEPDTTYRYTVAAVNADGQGPQSDETTVRTLAIPPDAVTGVSALGSSPTAVALTWDASARAERYEVSRDGAMVGVVSGMSFADQGLAPSTDYTYVIAAVNSGGSGPASEPVTTRTQDPPPAPSQVTGLSASATTAHGTTLTWDAANGAESYTVTRDGQTVHTGSEATYTDAGLAAQTEYTYTVTAVNAGGQGPESDPVTVVTLMDAPAKVLGVSAESTADSVRLRWDPVQGADSYTLRRDGEEVHTGTSAEFTDTSLSPDTEYTYRVRATNAGGDGVLSEPFAVRTRPLPPEAPTGLHVTGVTRTSVSLAWTASQGATGYAVERDGVEVGQPSSTTFTDTGLTAGTTYVYRVRAVGPGGTSAPSASTSSTTDATPVAVYRASGDTWRVNDSGIDLGTAWRAPGYADSAWRTGPTEIGYGDGDEATVLGWGTNASAKPITYYARSTFDAGSIADVTGMTLRLLVDDGAVVYLNGVEVHRFNLPTGTITSTTRASRYISGAEERQWRTVTLSPSALQAGQNTVAVEVHQDAPSSSDLSMNLELRPIR